MNGVYPLPSNNLTTSQSRSWLALDERVLDVEAAHAYALDVNVAWDRCHWYGCGCRLSRGAS